MRNRLTKVLGENTLKALLIAVSIAILTIITVIWLYDSSTKVKIDNVTDTSVFVTAKWRVESKVVGEIASNETATFTLSAEAAMVFVVSYPSGRVITTQGHYFTSNVNLNVKISNQGVEVSVDT